MLRYVSDSLRSIKPAPSGDRVPVRHPDGRAGSVTGPASARSTRSRGDGPVGNASLGASRPVHGIHRLGRRGCRRPLEAPARGYRTGQLRPNPVLQKPIHTTPAVGREFQVPASQTGYLVQRCIKDSRSEEFTILSMTAIRASGSISNAVRYDLRPDLSGLRRSKTWKHSLTKCSSDAIFSSSMH